MGVTRGFVGRRAADSSRVPPGQYVTRDFPVLSAGPTPYTPLDELEFRGPVGGHLVWDDDLVPVRLLCSARSRGLLIYRGRTERFGGTGV
ncbi:hypothetical protein EV645_6379 [Kribbella rubisoli]|uniref:Uncharacterized protein n=1 Tax=Kribbella rubisoli TaxID=3075929 RepID=A0A4Q7WPT2_9ACTN|nr:hypothetical protein [Kribbella rubisoli]RZU11219.1 hypothetical protein EV645_6379 [Kribbella rubisoli]